MGTNSGIFERAKGEWNKKADEFNQWSALGGDEKIELLNNEPFLFGDVVYFFKSGNQVEIIKQEDSNKYLVKRVDGLSSGKEMICNKTSLGWSMPGNELETLETLE